MFNQMCTINLQDLVYVVPADMDEEEGDDPLRDRSKILRGVLREHNRSYVSIMVQEAYYKLMGWAETRPDMMIIRKDKIVAVVPDE